MNLARREIIIIALTGLAVLYFIFDFFVAPAFKHKSVAVIETQKVDIENLLAEMGEYAKKDGSIDNLIYTVSRAGLAWPRDPFLKEDLASAATVESQKTKFNYTGFIMMGSQRLAVINGIEYQVGETLAPEGFIVRAINPNNIVIEDKTSRSRLSVPIQE